MKKEKRVLALYGIPVLAISALVDSIWLHSGVGAGLGPLFMLVPAAVAMVRKLAFYRGQKLLGLVGKQ